MRTHRTNSKWFVAVCVPLLIVAGQAVAGVINLNDFAEFAGLFNQAWNGLAPPNCQ